MELTSISLQNETRGCAEVLPATVIVLTMPSPTTVSLLAAAFNNNVQGSVDRPMINEGTSYGPEEKQVPFSTCSNKADHVSTQGYNCQRAFTV